MSSVVATAALLVSSVGAAGGATTVPVADSSSRMTPPGTTEARLVRAGIDLEERRDLRRTISRAAVHGPEEGVAMRRSVELHAELRRVLGPDAPTRVL